MHIVALISTMQWYPNEITVPGRICLMFKGKWSFWFIFSVFIVTNNFLQLQGWNSAVKLMKSKMMPCLWPSWP